ncbi:hypothetical protein EV177_004120 [Coemansia sp. RSA 1804]|nr:hypothetical protein EV177_004120 [Coemansia sp. RSA 1804]
MAAAQPFPLLASAGNSRSASPALSSSSTAAAGAVAKVAGSDKSNACETKHRPAKPAQPKKSRHNKNSKQNELSNSNSNGGDGSDGKASTATATQTATTAFSDTNAATNNNTQATRKKSTKKRPTKQKNPATASTETSAVSGTAAGEAAETAAAAESSNSDGAPKKQSAKSGKKKGRGKSRQQRNAVAGSETGASSRASSSLSQSQATAPRSPAQYIKSSSGSTLSMAMIVPGENGRARVYFGPTANEDHQLQQQQQQQQHAMHPGFHAGAPRFLASDVQQRRSSVGNFAPPRARFPVAQYGDGPMALGLGAPMMSAPQSASGAYFAPTSHLLANTRSVTSPSPAGYAYQPPSAHSAYNNAAPPSFRQRSMTSTQLRSTARSFLPQSHGSADYIHHPQTQLYSASAGQSRQPSYNAPAAMRRLSSATSVGVADHAGMHHPPLSAPALGALAGMRGRSQSVLTHSSTAGLRISMLQSRPGNALAPQLPALSRTQSNGSATGQPGAFASGGYFASRRASVSSTGLAVDPNNTIRIPAIMFQKPGVEDQSAATSAPPTAAALATPTSAADEKAPADANAADQTRSETVAMRRLQDMIESMRKLGGTKPAGPRDRETAVPTPPLSATETAAASASEAGLETTTVSATASAAPSEAVPSATADSGVAPSSSAAPAAGASPTPSAHPTSRFDSILEEDEDSEDDEAKLDADAQSDSAANASESESSSPPPLAARSVTAGQSTATSAVCAL